MLVGEGENWTVNKYIHRREKKHIGRKKIFTENRNTAKGDHNGGESVLPIGGTMRKDHLRKV